MNNKRSPYLLTLILLLSFNLLFGIILISGFLSKPHDTLSSDVFIAGLSGFLSFSFISMFFSIFAFVHVKKTYDSQFEKYGIDFIRENQKREQSAILMVIFSSFLIYPLFPIINAWLKSGLSHKACEHAKRQIRVKRVDKFLKQEEVMKVLLANEEARKVIKSTIELREQKVDTVFNCNLYILKILNELKAPYKIIYNPKEVYYIGMNY